MLLSEDSTSIEIKKYADGSWGMEDVQGNRYVMVDGMPVRVNSVPPVQYSTSTNIKGDGLF